MEASLEILACACVRDACVGACVWAYECTYVELRLTDTDTHTHTDTSPHPDAHTRAHSHPPHASTGPPRRQFVLWLVVPEPTRLRENRASSGRAVLSTGERTPGHLPACLPASLPALQPARRPANVVWAPISAQDSPLSVSVCVSVSLCVRLSVCLCTDNTQVCRPIGVSQLDNKPSSLAAS